MKNSALLMAVAVAASATAAQAAVHDAILYNATADAEIREAQPERTRGFGTAATSGQQTELQLSVLDSNRNLALLRFSLPTGTTAADLHDYASLKVFWRANANTNFGTPGTSVRLYGLDPSHPLNSTWNEQEVMYRDAGAHQNTTPAIGTGQSEPGPSPITQPLPGNVITAPPVAPISASPGYGADPNHARRAPGLVYNAPPFSQQIENENQARHTYNQAQRDAFLDGDDFFAYLPYINQPAYGVRATATSPVLNALTAGDGDPSTPDGYTNIYSDIPETNRPWDAGPTNTYVDDIDPALFTLIGYSNLQGQWNTHRYLDFGETAGADVTPAAHELIIRANLLSFLTAGLNAGETDFTFLLGRGTGTYDIDGDSTMDDIIGGGAMHLAAKEFLIGTDALSAPQLAIAPEPSSALLAGLGIASMLGLRRRSRTA